MKRALVFIAVFAASLLSSSSSGAAATVWIVDDDGEDCPNANFTTIQPAVNAASPGDRITVCEGTYHEQVTITTNNLTLHGNGPDDVVVDADSISNGITISNASGVTIEGFTVRRGHDNDIFLVNANHNTIRRNVLNAAVHDGIELVNSHDNVIEHNLSIDNLAANACGVNLTGGSKRNVVRHNTLRNNEWGIQITGAANDNVISHNTAVQNRGNGIRNIGGASGTLIERNRVFENGLTPTASTTGTTNAGIRLGSGSGLVVARNHAFDNQQFDILKESAATATFQNNHCETSSPPGLCANDDDD